MNKSNSQAFRQEIEAFSNKLVKEINQKIFTVAESYINQLASESVEEFHAAHSYVPNGYKPTGALSSFVHGYVNNDTFLIEASAQYGTGDWRVAGKYIYNLVFLQGFHGGAWTSNKPWTPHPKPGIPYYRLPMPDSEKLNEVNEKRKEKGKKELGPYRSWGRPATQSEAPISILRNKIIYFNNNEFKIIKQQIIDECVRNHIDELKSIIKKYPNKEYVYNIDVILK